MQRRSAFAPILLASAKSAGHTFDVSSGRVRPSSGPPLNSSTDQIQRRSGASLHRTAEGSCPYTDTLSTSPTNSCRRASKRRGRADRRKIRKGPRQATRSTNLLPTRQTPTTEVRVSSCGISGIRPFLCHRLRLRIGDCIPCRCIRRWACAAPVPIRMNLWGVRKSQNPAAIPTRSAIPT